MADQPAKWITLCRYSCAKRHMQSVASTSTDARCRVLATAWHASQTSDSTLIDSTQSSGILSRMFARIALRFTALCCSLFASTTSESAFDALKALQGTWRIEVERKPMKFQMSYALGSNQSIVTEQFGKELSVFYLNGQNLEMIHFCNRGNQPYLRLTDGSVPGVLRFEMFDIRNLGEPDAPHVRAIIYKLLDANTFELEIVWQPSGSEKYTLHRIRGE